ncbi:CP110-like protein [Mya arenaria]|uniref:CP110-like protein n=1 Tax=Mya arenaria TaxID=6604 RepID=A0ABY7DJV2_MYAAR|nr:CP110-like protein [Mya arenaria]
MLRGNQGYKGQGAPGGMAPPQNQDMNSSQSTNPFIYPSSPSLLINPKDRDNTSEVSGFAQATPKQLVFSNQSTPVQTKAYKPIQHSPMKPVSSQRRKDRFSIPAKLQSGLLDIHEIFFMIPVAERMAIIANQREQDQEKMLRHQGRHSLDSVSRSQPKLSKATLKAMERKKQAKIAEESVFGSMEFRTKSAPPSTSSPAMDIREMKERPKTAPENRKQDPNRAKKSSGSKSSRSSTGTSSNKQKSAGSQKQSSQPKQSATLGSQKHTNAQNMQKPTKKTDKAWR